MAEEKNNTPEEEEAKETKVKAETPSAPAGNDTGRLDEEDDFSSPEEGIVNEPDKGETPAEINGGNGGDVGAAVDMVNNKPKERKPLPKALKIAFLVIGIILVILLIIYGICAAKAEGDAAEYNVYVGNANVSGYTYDNVLKAVNDASSVQASSEISLVCGDRHYVITGQDISLSVNNEETAQKAFNYGKTGNRLKDGLTLMMLLVHKKQVFPMQNVNDDQLNTCLGRFGHDMYGILTQHAVDVTDAGATITPGKSGFDENTDKAREEVKEALHREQTENINVTLNVAHPDELKVEDVDHKCYKDAVDARYEVKGNDVSVTQEENGRFIDKTAIAELIKKVKEGGEKVDIPVSLVEAKVKKEDLQAKLFSGSLGSYSTNYGSSGANRCANIARAASLINGTVVEPGGVFSFNDTVGKRTTSNGFYTAKEYVQGQTVDGIGGGTCQVSSTLYDAVLYSDLGIVSRTNHMMTVGYLPLGQDATVSDNGPDFKFRNTSDYPVKVSAYTGGATITVSIVGTPWDPERKVKISNSVSNVGGNTIVNSIRYVYSGDELISKDNLGESSYQPHK